MFRSCFAPGLACRPALRAACGAACGAAHGPGRAWVFSLCFLAAASLFSCGIESLFEHRLLVRLPPPPVAWEGFGPLEYRLFWQDEKGNARHLSVKEGQSPVLCLKRGERQAILARVFCGTWELKPAGALYPSDLAAETQEFPSARPDALLLSFESGYAAEVAFYIKKSGFDPWAYPVEKLKAVREKNAKDPWALPPWKSAAALVEERFRLSAFPSSPNTYRLPADRRWQPESPFCPISAEEGGQSALLFEGMHLFFGGQEKLIVNVGESGIIVQRAGVWSGPQSGGEGE